MNYDNMQELFDAQTTNATSLGGLGDYGTATIRPPQWFKFNGLTNKDIWLYADNALYLGTQWDNDHDCIWCIKFDNYNYEVWTETGTLYNEFEFFRLWVRGNGVFGGPQYKYQIIFFNTGDFCIHTIVNNRGQSNFVKAGETYTFTMNTTTPYVTFHTLDENNSTFEMEYAIIDLEPQYWLVKDTSDVYYTIQNDTLVRTNITTLNREAFETWGFKLAEVPTYKTLIAQIPDVTIYASAVDSAPIVYNAEVTAIPFNQVIYSDNMYRPQVGTYVTVLGIENVTVEYEGTPLIAVSFDDGTTWKAYKNNQWTTLQQETSGNTAAEIESISTQAWNDMFDVTRQTKFRITLTEGDSLTELVVHYLNPDEEEIQNA